MTSLQNLLAWNTHLTHRITTLQYVRHDKDYLARSRVPSGCGGHRGSLAAIPLRERDSGLINIELSHLFLCVSQVFLVGTVVATASREESLRFCQKMGADNVINHYDPLRRQ